MKNYLDTIFTRAFLDGIVDAADAPVAGIFMIISLLCVVIFIFVSLWRALMFALLAFILGYIEVDNQKTRWL
jgi:hypothetical protein